MNSEPFENQFKKKLANLAGRHGVKLLFLPPYSPGFNPIEKTWANIKRALIDILPDAERLQNAIYGYFMIPNFKTKSRYVILYF